MCARPRIRSPRYRSVAQPARSASAARHRRNYRDLVALREHLLAPSIALIHGDQRIRRQSISARKRLHASQRVACGGIWRKLERELVCAEQVGVRCEEQYGDGHVEDVPRKLSDDNGPTPPGIEPYASATLELLTPPSFPPRRLHRARRCRCRQPSRAIPSTA